MERTSMQRCIRCEREHSVDEYRVKTYTNRGGERVIRSGICRACERLIAQSNHKHRPPRRKPLRMPGVTGPPDREEWWRQLAPWPWEPGKKVF